MYQRLCMLASLPHLHNGLHAARLVPRMEGVARAVRRGVELGKDLSELGLAELRQFSDRIEGDVDAALSLEGSLAARNHIGGTAPAQVRAAIARAREELRP